MLDTIHVVFKIALYLAIIYLVFTSVRSLLEYLRERKEKRCPKILVKSIICACVALSVIVFGARHIYPFEQKLDFELVAECEVAEEYEYYIEPRFWHAAYEAYGIYGHSYFFNPNLENPVKGIALPEMDYENNNYILSYGQKIASLSFNIWETVLLTPKTGAYEAHVIFENEYLPGIVYVYEIPKIRVENSVREPYHYVD